MAASKNTRKPLFERLKQGLEEGINLRTVEIPEEPPQVDPRTLTELRQRARMSQTVFAKLLNVSSKTVQSWEQGIRKPSHASLRLIEVFGKRPQVLCELAGLKLIGPTDVIIHGLAKTVHVGGRKKLVVRKIKK